MNAIIFECYILTYMFLYTSGLIFFRGLKVTVYIYFCKYIHIHRNTQTQYKESSSCTQMFALCRNRTRDLLRSRRVFPPIRQIGRQKIISQKFFLKSHINFIRQCFYQSKFKPISKRQFETSEARILNVMLFQSSDTS
jgi:hypothetical protein